jgi:hypothetical protein
LSPGLFSGLLGDEVRGAAPVPQCPAGGPRAGPGLWEWPSRGWGSVRRNANDCSADVVNKAVRFTCDHLHNLGGATGVRLGAGPSSGRHPWGRPAEVIGGDRGPCRDNRTGRIISGSRRTSTTHSRNSRDQPTSATSIGASLCGILLWRRKCRERERSGARMIRHRRAVPADDEVDDLLQQRALTRAASKSLVAKVQRGNARRS